MKLITAGILATLFVATFGLPGDEHKKVVCYWNSTSIDRQGSGRFEVEDLRPSFIFCTHLVYGYAGIDPVTFEVTSLHPHLDTDSGHAFFRIIPQLKWSFPNLKVYLSIGGNDDPYEDTHKYLVVTETAENRAKFVNSVGRLLNDYQFDGVDLAWQFPEVKLKKNRNIFGRIWQKTKKIFGYGKFKDEKETEHRDGFTELVRDLRNLLRQSSNKALTVTVLPHVNSSIYYDAGALAPEIDAVHLFVFDQKTPQRNPKEADYPAPIYESYGRLPNENIVSEVSYWINRGVSGWKIVVGIPTFARTWKLTVDSPISGVPPITVDGPGAAGPQTQTPGLLSYTEVCLRQNETAVDHLRYVNDPMKKYGSYGFQMYNDQTGADGIWVGYESPDTAGNKAAYSKMNGLGGVAIVDLSLDDFRGICTGNKYPILRAVKYKL